MGAPWRTARVWARRRIKLARARAASVLRQNYMLVFTLGALAIAFAVGSGVFSGGSSRPVRVAAEPTVALVLTPRFDPNGTRFTITYFLVSTESSQYALRATEAQMGFREVLRTNHFEVLLVRTPEEELAAMREVDLGRVRAPAAVVVVVDLRAQ